MKNGPMGAPERRWVFYRLKKNKHWDTESIRGWETIEKQNYIPIQYNKSVHGNYSSKECINQSNQLYANNSSKECINQAN